MNFKHTKIKEWGCNVIILTIWKYWKFRRSDLLKMFPNWYKVK